MQISKVYNDPFDHVVIDDFITEEFSQKIVNEFPDYNSNVWSEKGYVYDNPLERKRTLREWSEFQTNTYQLFMYLCGEFITNKITNLFQKENNLIPLSIVPDFGLHGAGYHMHMTGDYLNVHLDYSIHPKANLQRKFNLILYLTPNWNPEWGGGLELWSHDENTKQPKEKIKIIENKFRRAVIFDTTQNSWHGVSTPINCPENIYRKSAAMYYLTHVDKNAEERKRALFAPRKEQENNIEINNLIKKRYSI
jgi:Rps23 Pro-64 3,4-dihydroxylase Tpa1-like proline 4-hydroxylase